MATTFASPFCLLSTGQSSRLQLPTATINRSNTNFRTNFVLDGLKITVPRNNQHYSSNKAANISNQRFTTKALPLSEASDTTDAPSPPVRAANLGGWLVVDGWMTPDLFDNIDNKDLLDGTKLKIKSVARGTHLCAEATGGNVLWQHSNVVPSSDTFTLWRVSPSTFQLKTPNGLFVGLPKVRTGDLIATATSPGKDETFEITRNSDNPNLIRMKASNGNYLQVKPNGAVTADYSQESTTWGSDDPSVFLISVVFNILGEFQLTNGYGQYKATQVLTDHWNTYVTEDDFQFMSNHGVNAVRVPVGYWIAYEDNPPWPFVAGSLTALDNAFTWGEKYDIRIIIDLHAAPGAQNTQAHSASRDGSYLWGKGDTVQKTIEVIDFLANRYANKPNLLAIELINEPLDEATLADYYQNGYKTVRKYSSSCYVILSNRMLGNTVEFLELAANLDRAVIDAHYYHIIWDTFAGMTAKENINYVKTERVAEMNIINPPNGRPLLFIGEWTGEWQVKDATAEQLKQFVATQQEVYGHATFGWGYWSLKNNENNNHWNMEWMIKNGYLKID